MPFAFISSFIYCLELLEANYRDICTEPMNDPHQRIRSGRLKSGGVPNDSEEIMNDKPEIDKAQEQDGQETSKPSGASLDRHISRRDLIRGFGMAGVAIGGSTLLAACGLGGSSSGVSSKSASGSTTAAPEPKVVYIRSLGGAYDAAWKKAAWIPFEQATGIKVVGVPSSPAQILADAKANRVPLDVVDLGEFATIKLSQGGILQPLNTSAFTETDVNDLVGPKSQYYVPSFAFSLVLGYSKKAFPSNAPSNWSDFWNFSGFPGTRTLEGISAGNPNLEQALLADGVPMDKIYPIDINRAFNKLAEIKSRISTYWETGAQSAELFTTGSATVGSVWNGRIQVPINTNFPLAIQWNQAERLYQCFSIPKGAAHPQNALQYIDFALQPKVLAEFASGIFYGPSNKKSYNFISPTTAALLPTSPEHTAISFAQDANWWVQNFSEVSSRWASFIA